MGRRGFKAVVQRRGPQSAGPDVDLPTDGLLPARNVTWATAPPWSLAYNHGTARVAMTSEQAAQLIDDTLDLVHQRLLDLESNQQSAAHQALAEEFREWRHPSGGHIDLMVCPGFSSP